MWPTQEPSQLQRQTGSKVNGVEDDTSSKWHRGKSRGTVLISE